MKEARGTPRSKSGKNQISEGVEEQDANDSVALGDVIYIKLPSGSWWPAQVCELSLFLVYVSFMEGGIPSLMLTG